VKTEREFTEGVSSDIDAANRRQQERGAPDTMLVVGALVGLVVVYFVIAAVIELVR
jgi:hypothetical protein